MKQAFYFTLSLVLTTPLFAEEDIVARPAQSMWQTLMMIAIALLFFYLILWRPEQKRRKKMEQQRSGLAKGDRVTAMGIIGTVDQIQENTVILKMVDGAKIEVLKGAISDVQSAANTQAAASSQTKKDGA